MKCKLKIFQVLFLMGAIVIESFQHGEFLQERNEKKRDKVIQIIIKDKPPTNKNSQMPKLEERKAQIKDQIINKLNFLMDHLKTVKRSESKSYTENTTENIFHFLTTIADKQKKKPSYSAEIIPEPDGYTSRKKEKTATKKHEPAVNSTNYDSVKLSDDVTLKEYKQKPVNEWVKMQTPITERIGLPFMNSRPELSQELLPLQPPGHK